MTPERHDLPQVEQEAPQTSYYLKYPAAKEASNKNTTKILIEPDPYNQLSSMPSDIKTSGGLKRRVPSDARYIAGHQEDEEDDMKVMLVMPRDDEGEFPQMPRDHLSNKVDSDIQPYFCKPLLLTLQRCS